ncbi:hypothetical protein IFM89_031211 [Coptis chinensis]|uniref:Uncharacterized protein n=1 Tax=Coptis chinensis TaxID=261450 RepID=A0A835IVM4_9MAGN|nr:hypothetical protein IFM89_031211 [Coptis chinensis]
MAKKKNGENSACSQKYGVPSYSVVWVPTNNIFDKQKPMENDEQDSELSSSWLVFCGGGGKGRSGIPNSLLLAQFDSNSLSPNPLASNEYHPLPFESGQDGRSAKVPRTKSRDVNRRSPMHPVYRTTPLSNNSYVGHHCTSENRVESRDYKDSRDPKVDKRDFKGETRDMYAESRVEPQSGNGVRIESRGDDSKEVKHDRESHMEFKGTSKIGRDSSTIEERGYLEAHADEENKFVIKSDDKLKDKDRKKKGEKLRDWGERDKDRIDRRSNLPLGNSSSEHREITREERESERWERNRKDIQKEKERPKEREKDHIKNETLNGIEKEGLHNEKESADGSIRTPELENLIVEQRRQKEHDGWKAGDRESKDKKKERDVESEGDRHEKCGKCYDKESDEGLMEGDGGHLRAMTPLQVGKARGLTLDAPVTTSQSLTTTNKGLHTLNMGMAVGRDLKGGDNHVVAIIGDGAMTAGQAYEAMNNAGYLDTDMIVIFNDNKQVSLPTANLDGPLPPVGALTSALSRTWSVLHWPVDGHNIDDLLTILKAVKSTHTTGPVFIHVVTDKGRGYPYAERTADKYHGISKFDPATGKQFITLSNGLYLGFF